MKTVKNGHTMEGKNGYLFLTNDGSFEILQHFDSGFDRDFDANTFGKKIDNNHNIAKKNKIEYYFFVVPDKSVVCKDYLPFDVGHCYRVANEIKHDNFFDLYNDKLTPDDYFKNDSHVNYDGGQKLVKEIVKILKLDASIIDDHIAKNVKRRTLCNHMGDLTAKINFKLDKDPAIFKETINIYDGQYQDITSTLPTKFRYMNLRKTIYIKSKDAICKKKVLIYRDSSTNLMVPFLSAIFDEIILYWYHNFYNEELIEYFKPDYLFEIKTERFLDKYDISRMITIKSLPNDGESLDMLYTLLLNNVDEYSYNEYRENIDFFYNIYLQVQNKEKCDELLKKYIMNYPNHDENVKNILLKYRKTINT